MPRRPDIGKADIGLDDPVPLGLAPKLFFPAGGVTIRSLRTEISKGRLVVERIAGKDYVTKRAIKQMRNKCRVQPKAPASTSGVGKGENRNGLSETERKKRSLAAAKAMNKMLRESSQSTSPKNTSRMSGQ